MQLRRRPPSPRPMRSRPGSRTSPRRLPSRGAPRGRAPSAPGAPSGVMATRPSAIFTSAGTPMIMSQTYSAAAQSSSPTPRLCSATPVTYRGVPLIGGIAALAGRRLAVFGAGMEGQSFARRVGPAPRSSSSSTTLLLTCPATRPRAGPVPPTSPNSGWRRRRCSRAVVSISSCTRRNLTLRRAPRSSSGARCGRHHADGALVGGFPGPPSGCRHRIQGQDDDGDAHRRGPSRLRTRRRAGGQHRPPRDRALRRRQP